MIDPFQRPKPGKKEHIKETDILFPSRIRTRNLTQRAAVDTHLRRRGRWDSRNTVLLQLILVWKAKDTACVLKSDKMYLIGPVKVS